MFARLILLALVLCAAAPCAHAVALGATREQVIEELGQPAAQATRNNREILTYPKGVRLTLEGGHVVSAEKIILSVDESFEPTPDPAAPAMAPEPTPTPTRAAPATVKPPSAAAAPTLAPTRAPTRVPTPTPDADVAEIKELSAPAAEQVQALREKLGAASPALAPPKKQSTDDLPLMGVALLLATHLTLTLIGLLIAFRVWNMNALNSGIFAIALIDLALHMLFQALGPLTDGLSTLSAVEYGIPGIVMIFTIHRFTFSKNMSDAVRAALLVKLLVAGLRLAVAGLLVKQTFS